MPALANIKHVILCTHWQKKIVDAAMSMHYKHSQSEIEGRSEVCRPRAERRLRERNSWIHDAKELEDVCDGSGESTSVSPQKLWNVADFDNSETMKKN